MADELTKEKHSKRLFTDKVKAKKQKNILKDYHLDVDPFESVIYFNKKHALICGNSNCVMCGNPRKFFGEKTIQEKKFDEYVDTLKHDIF